MTAATANTGLPKPVPTPWRQPIGDYLTAEAAAGRPPQTLATRRSHLERVARALRCAPADVDGGRLLGWFARQSQWSMETRRSYRTTLRSFFKWAVATGITEVNPALVLPRMKPAKRTPRPAPDLAVRIALAAGDDRTRLMLRLAAEVGMRRAEIACVHTSDLIDGARGPQLLVHGKGDKQRIVPISESLAAAVRAGAAGHSLASPSKGFLFPGAYGGGHLSPRWVGKLMGTALPDHWTAHTLRHRFATKAYRGSRNLRAVQELLGHASVTTTEIYTGVDDDELRAAMMAATDSDGSPS